MTPAMRKMISEYLIDIQLRGPIPFGFGYFGKHADILWEKIEDQREKDEMELRQRVAAMQQRVATDLGIALTQIREGGGGGGTGPY